MYFAKKQHACFYTGFIILNPTKKKKHKNGLKTALIIFDDAFMDIFLMNNIMLTKQNG